MANVSNVICVLILISTNLISVGRGQLFGTGSSRLEDSITEEKAAQFQEIVEDKE